MDSTWCERNKPTLEINKISMPYDLKPAERIEAELISTKALFLPKDHDGGLGVF